MDSRFEFIGAGSQATVSRYNDLCIKTYNRGILNYRISKEIFDYFSNAKFANFGNIRELFYDGDLVTGYKMDYYKKSDKLILDMDMDYLLCNLKSIFNYIDTLSKDGVCVVDLWGCNMVTTDDKIIIIDYDRYYFNRTCDRNKLKYINRGCFTDGLNDLVVGCFSSPFVDFDYVYATFDNLVNEYSSIDSIYRKVKGKKLVRDIFNPKHLNK